MQTNSLTIFLWLCSSSALDDITATYYTLEFLWVCTDCIWIFTVACFVGWEGMDPFTDHHFDPSLREVLDKAMSSGECLLGGCTDSVVAFCTLMVKRDMLQPWPPPHQLQMQVNGVQLRPTPWPSFMVKGPCFVLVIE